MAGPQDDDKYDPNRPLTAREQAMNDIAATNDQRIAEELRAQGIELEVQHGEQPAPAPGPKDEPTPTPAPPAHLGLDPELAAQLGREPVPMEALDDVPVRVKIDGVERVTTLREYRRTAQLDGAAQSRFDQANRVLAEAERLRKLAEGAAAAPQPPVGVEGKDAKTDSLPATEEASQLVTALMVGDEEKATELMTKALQRLQTPQQTDTSNLVAKAAAEVKQQLSTEDAEAKFRSEYSDIVQDPALARVADGFFDEVMASDPQKSHAEALIEAGKKTREWKASIAGPAPAPSPTASPRDRRLERKSQIDEVGGLGTKAKVPEEVAQSPSDVIAEMKKQRGLN